MRRDNPYFMNARQYKAFKEAKHPVEVGEMVYEDCPGEHSDCSSDLSHWAGRVCAQTFVGVVYVMAWLNGFDKGTQS